MPYLPFLFLFFDKINFGVTAEFIRQVVLKIIYRMNLITCRMNSAVTKVE